MCVDAKAYFLYSRVLRIWNILLAEIVDLQTSSPTNLTE